MNSNLVYITGGNKKIDFEAVAELAGIKVIKLLHPRAFVNDQVSMRGFQGGTMQVSDRGGVSLYKFVPFVNKSGEDTFTPKNLWFEKDDRTNENLAVIPDTKYNRKKLAGMYGTIHAPRIKDPVIDAEVRAMAEKIQKTVEVKKTKEVEAAKALSENESLKKALEKAKKDNERLMNRGTMLTAAVSDNSKLINFIRKSVENEVFSEKASLIEELKKSGEGWQSQGQYKKIVDEIDKRCIEKLKDEGIDELEYRANC